MLVERFTKAQYRACKNLDSSYSDAENLGIYICEKREAAGLSIKQLASALDIPQEYLSDMEDGYAVTLTADKIRLLPKYLNLSGEESAVLFDLAAKAMSSMPIDIADYISKNKDIKDFIRVALYGNGAKSKLCRRFMKNLVRMSDETAEKVLESVEKK